MPPKQTVVSESAKRGRMGARGWLPIERSQVAEEVSRLLPSGDETVCVTNSEVRPSSLQDAIRA